VKKGFLITCLVALLLAGAAWWQRGPIEKNYYGWRVYRLRGEVLEQEQRQIKNIPAHQIYNELEWIYGKTHEYCRVRDRIGALRAALDDPQNYTAEDEQSPDDGS